MFKNMDTTAYHAVVVSSELIMGALRIAPETPETTVFKLGKPVQPDLRDYAKIFCIYADKIVAGVHRR